MSEILIEDMISYKILFMTCEILWPMLAAAIIRLLIK